MNYLTIRETIVCYCKRLLFPRGITLNPPMLPHFFFMSEEIRFNLNTTNNNIRTPQGFFRICFEHLPYREYIEMLTDFYNQVPDNQKPKRGYDYFIKKGLRDWMLNGNKYQYQTFNVCSTMAEERIAGLLGLNHLLTHSKFCKLQIDSDITLLGSMSSDAGGVDVRELKDNFKDVFTPELVKNLTSLNIIDAICYEKDHRPGNYHIILNNQGKAVSVCCFDNDSPWSFSPFGGISFKTYAGASELIRAGKINRPLFDKKVSDRLMALKKNDIESSLSSYLGKNQVNACWRRIVSLQKALSRTHFDFDNWTEEIMREELSGKYGNTYYTILYRLCEAIKQGKY